MGSSAFSLSVKTKLWIRAADLGLNTEMKKIITGHAGIQEPFI